MLSCCILPVTDCVSALPWCPNEVRLQINMVYSHPLDCLDLSEPGFNWPQLSVSLRKQTAISQALITGSWIRQHLKSNNVNGYTLFSPILSCT